jgi:phospholipid/cholesterol/gamma-HCH transport system substrate-binding protein
MSSAVKVGVFMTVALAALAFLVLRVEELELFGGRGPSVDAVFDSVAGLDDKAAVRVAGVRVGRVDGIRLADERARVTLRLDEVEPPLRLTQGTRATVASLSLLGEKYVELDLGPPDAPPLPDGAVIEGTVPLSFDQAMGKLSDVADSIQQVTGSLSGEGGGESSLERLIANLEATSADIRALVRANRDQVSATVGNFERFSATLAEELPRLTQQIERVLAQVESVVAENRDDLRGSMGNIRDITERLQVSVDNLNQISGKIAAGEGTIGKLVQSDQAHDQLISALDSIDTGVKSLGDTLGRVGKLKLDLGFEGSYFEGREESRTAFSLNLQPPSNRFYFVEAADDPEGRQRTKTQVQTVTGPDGVARTTTTETLTREDKITLSAQFGFRFGAASLRAGLFESTGGAAIDYGLFDRRLLFSLEAFDFSREESQDGVRRELDPRLRLTGRYLLNPNIYVVGGYDDVLVSDRDSLFLGAGVRWSDDDLKYLLGSIPRF